MIGDRWMLLILRSALYGIRPLRRLSGGSQHPPERASNRLAALVESGIIKQREYREDGQRARIEYPLTEMGRTLGLPFIAMTAWGDKWLGDGKSPLTLRSKSSGRKLSVALIDEHGKAVKSSDVETVIDTGVSGTTGKDE